MAVTLDDYCRNVEIIISSNWHLFKTWSTQARFLRGDEVVHLLHDKVDMVRTTAAEFAPTNVTFDALIQSIAGDYAEATRLGRPMAPKIVIANMDTRERDGTHWFVVMYDIDQVCV